MGKNRPTVCVTMIVKNEGHVIERALAAIRPFCDHWAIVDTGSTDDTLAAIGRATKGWDGKLGHVTWTGFGDARTESLRLAAETGADYAFVLDADEVFSPEPGFAWPSDGKDVYQLEMSLSGVHWLQARLFRIARGWIYTGVLHEGPYALETKPCGCPDPVTSGIAHGLRLTTPRDGARSQNPNKYRDDALVLEAELAKDPTNARYAFYAGQSWRDAKDWDKAIEWYERRIRMGDATNAAEVPIAMFEVARAMHRLGRPDKDVRAAYLRAYSADPRRAEPLCHLAMFCREQHDFVLAWHFASLAAEKPVPEGLFVDTKIYRWLAKDELAIALAHLGRLDVAIQITRSLLDVPGLPEAERQRISGNLESFMGLLQGPSAAQQAA